MTAYPLQSPPHAGAQVTWQNPPASGDTVQPGTKVGLAIFNASGSSITASIPLPPSDGQTVTARSVTVVAGAFFILPLPSAVYGTSPVVITYTGTLTQVYAGLISIP